MSKGDGTAGQGGGHNLYYTPRLAASFCDTVHRERRGHSDGEPMAGSQERRGAGDAQRVVFFTESELLETASAAERSAGRHDAVKRGWLAEKPCLRTSWPPALEVQNKFVVFFAKNYHFIKKGNL